MSLAGFWRSWRLALRIARRDALRAKGRSILVIAMIALPIVGVSAIDLSIRSSQLTATETMERQLGNADARIQDTDAEAIHQKPSGDRYVVAGADGEIDDEAGVGFAGQEQPEWVPDPGGEEALERAAAVMPGAELHIERSIHAEEVRTGNGLTGVEVRELDVTEPLFDGLQTVLEGRMPSEGGEIAVTEEFREASGVSVGDTLTFEGPDTELTISGVYELPSMLWVHQVLVLPESGLVDDLARYAADTGFETLVSAGFFVDAGTDVTWEQVQAVNAQGWLVVSRAVGLDPPPRADVPYFASGDDDGSGGTGGQVILVTVIALVILEICLLAGPAFAVGARRSRRMLGLIGANGGDRRHTRAIMLASGALLGLAAAVVGIALGFVAMLLAQSWLEESEGARFGALTVVPLELLAICGLGVGIGLLAALLPAITASRAPVLESLTGRRGVRRVNRLLPIGGAVAFVLGAAMALAGAFVSDSSTVVAAGAILAQLGLVAMTPWLVGVFGSVGRWLPLSGRLALRDAVRNRPRTAPAVAAVLAAVSGAVAVATVFASQDAQNRDNYDARAPYGTVVVITDEAAVAGDSADAVTRTLGVTDRADLARLVPGDPGCRLYQWAENCGMAAVHMPPENECDWDAHHEALDAAIGRGETLGMDDVQPECREDNWAQGPTFEEVVVGTPDVLAVMGMNDQEAVRALERGEAVVYDRSVLHEDGTVRIDVFTTDREDYYEKLGTPDALEPDRRIVLPAVVGDFSPDGARVAKVLLPESATEEAGVATAPFASLFSTGEQPGDAPLQALNERLSALPADVDVYVETGHTSDAALVLLVLGLFAMVVTLGAAGIATGLAQADSEADLATLSAVGAPPRVRRTLSGLQCAVIAGMGVLLGAVSGLIPGAAIVLSGHRSDLVYWEQFDFSDPAKRPELFLEVPWGTMFQLVVLVPMVAGLVAMLLTRSRSSVARRAE
ncbi:ABC transporter permease [Streptomyces otsuchiensis]|uniref:ABC transporter permease n=1 Tax=Streptomyces otsuchiensis TaxID=2681388 RepID=UPI00103225C3|nr:ABC transporter permease [Streptomyces otsuchiensis]